jgi:hypothetical protein
VFGLLITLAVILGKFRITLPTERDADPVHTGPEPDPTSVNGPEPEKEILVQL